MKKILVILTGGTIGSKNKDGVIDVSENSVELILKYADLYDNQTQFDTVCPYNILSENITPQNWNLLLETLYNTHFDSYQGIVITHGSDTMSYTCALLGIAFAGCQIPIIVTASNYPLSDERSNGLENFRSAVSLIKENKLKGVFAVYRGKNGKNSIYLSTRILQCDIYTDEFLPFGEQVFGYLENGKTLINTSISVPNISDLLLVNPQPLRFQVENSVMMISPYPGINYKEINIPKGIKAILHTLYHSSTAPANPSSGLLELIYKCKKQGIDFYICPVKESERAYSTGRSLIDCGAIPLKGISVPAAYAKLHLAYGQNKMPPLEFMSENFFFEYI